MPVRRLAATKMVAVQMLLMNYFLLGLSSDEPLSDDFITAVLAQHPSLNDVYLPSGESSNPSVGD